jgi:hypothetical protein
MQGVILKTELYVNTVWEHSDGTFGATSGYSSEWLTTSSSAFHLPLCKRPNAQMFCQTSKHRVSIFKCFKNIFCLQLSTSLGLMHRHVNQHIVALDNCVCFKFSLLVVQLSILNLTHTHTLLCLGRQKQSPNIYLLLLTCSFRLLLYYWSFDQLVVNTISTMNTTLLNPWRGLHMA